ncbi:hypothetical protein MMC31_005326 [Peltigera leucophlebia]|nr:hypothetical protein [Peltigera leucophlebia]
MYSHVGIIIGAVVSALLGLYVFVPDGGLQRFNYYLSIWQPIVWDAPPAVVRPSYHEEGKEQLIIWDAPPTAVHRSSLDPSSLDPSPLDPSPLDRSSLEEGKEQPTEWDAPPAVVRPSSLGEGKELRLPAWLRERIEKEEKIEEMHRQGFSDEKILRSLRGLSDIPDPETRPRISPKLELGPFPRVSPWSEPDPLPRIVPFHIGIFLIFFALCQQFVLFVLPCLIPIALVQKTYALRKMRKLYEAEKVKVAELEEKLKIREARDKTRAEDGQGLPNAKGLPAKRRRSGKGNRKKGRKAKDKRKRARKAAV